MKPIIPVIALILSSSLVVAAETSEEGVVRIEKKWMEDGDFTQEFWILSDEVAQKHGIAVIDRVMERSKKWQGMEGLIYVPMLALLPRKEAVAKLKEYESGTDESNKLWAGEFLIEFEISDTITMVKKYGAEQDGSGNPDKPGSRP
jgi:hypothetical protein